MSSGLDIYSLGTAEGTMARIVSELADGNIRTLSCSPNAENERSFYAHGRPPHASFLHGPFHHLTKERLRVSNLLPTFSSGFDIILEDTTFQMYSPNRRQQIGFVAQHLKPGGIFIIVEKFLHDDEREYRRREFQKDYGFKARHFSSQDIAAKEKTVLTRMNKNEVTLSQMSAVLQELFKECFVTWNSGNSTHSSQATVGET